MKFKNISGQTMTVRYGDMITIQNNEIVELPLTYERKGLERVTERIEEVIIETPKVEKEVKKSKGRPKKK
jgi:hypothetical protein